MAKRHNFLGLDEVDEPGVFSGMMTLFGALLGAFLVVYSALYGPLASVPIGVVIGGGFLFCFLLASFAFLLGWLLEISWPLLVLMGIVATLLVLPLYFYFGSNVLIDGVSRALMFG